MLSLLVLSTLHFNCFGVGVVALGRRQRLNILTGIGNDASKVREYETPCKDSGRLCPKLKKSEESLKGWVAIAKFLSQPVSTVQRWANEGMDETTTSALNTF